MTSVPMWERYGFPALMESWLSPIRNEVRVYRESPPAQFRRQITSSESERMAHRKARKVGT